MADKALERRLRAARSTLAVSGRSIIFFSAWGILKTMFSFMYSSEWSEYREMVYYGEPAMRIMGFIFLFILIGISAGSYFYVGGRAIAAGHGKKTGKLYIILGGIMAFFSVLSIAAYLVSWWLNKGHFIYLVEAAVNVIIIVAITDLLAAAVTNRRCSRMIDRKGIV